MAESVMAIDIAGLVDTKRGLIGRPIFIGRAGVSARYRIPNPLDIWRRVLDWVSALYSMTAEVLQYRRYRSPGAPSSRSERLWRADASAGSRTLLGPTGRAAPSVACRGGPPNLLEPISNAAHRPPDILDKWHIRKAISDDL
jgi:hypothetical protein